MLRFVIKRFAMMVASLFLIALFTFVLMHSIPGGPFTRDRQLPPAVEEALNAKYHLDDPLWKQFLSYVWGLFHGDLGPSFSYEGRSVNDFIASGFPVSAKLGGLTIAFILICAIPMGIVAARRSGRWQDALIMGISTLGLTIPSFVVATTLLYFVSFRWGLTPNFGLGSAKAYLLPVFSLGIYSIAFIARLMRSSLLDVLNQDYIRTARAKGQTEFKILTRHALRNAIIPVLTILGPTVAGILTGSFVIERVFAIPGLGVHFVDSISNRDYTAIMGVTIFYATFLITMVLVVDIFIMLVDPRVSYE